MKNDKRKNNDPQNTYTETFKKTEMNSGTLKG
jgi:hypothetical protein